MALALYSFNIGLHRSLGGPAKIQQVLLAGVVIKTWQQNFINEADLSQDAWEPGIAGRTWSESFAPTYT